MVEISPFRATTLNPLINEKENLVAPVYDTIDDEMYTRYASNKRNVIHAVRRRRDMSLDEFVEVADHTLKMLFSEHVLKEREKESFYIYSIQYTIPDELRYEIRGELRKDDYTLVGLVALVDLDEGEDSILGHESVFDYNTEERYYLMKRCRMNLSPILAEYNGDEIAIGQILGEYIRANLPLIEVTHSGEKHSLWEINDTHVAEEISRGFKGQKLMILDGHHRYTASLMLKERDGITDTMMMLVGGRDPNLLLLPWHRCIRGVDKDYLKDLLKEYTDGGCRGYDEFIQDFNGDGAVKTAVYDGSGFRMLRGLDIFELQKLLIDPMLRIGGEISFIPTIKEAARMVDEGRYTISFLVKPPEMSIIEEMAHRGIPLPQKSTRFLPKVMEGIIMRRF